MCNASDWAIAMGTASAGLLFDGKRGAGFAIFSGTGRIPSCRDLLGLNRPTFPA